jgi:hypothetical protein
MVAQEHSFLDPANGVSFPFTPLPSQTNGSAGYKDAIGLPK